VPPDSGDDSRVQLTRIEGGINLLNERLGSVKEDVVDLKGSHHRLANRVGVLEADNHLRKGERAGFVASGKLFQWVTGGGVLGTIALLWKAFAG
jgi:hypothetical protein